MFPLLSWVNLIQYLLSATQYDPGPNQVDGLLRREGTGLHFLVLPLQLLPPVRCKAVCGWLRFLLKLWQCIYCSTGWLSQRKGEDRQ